MCGIAGFLDCSGHPDRQAEGHALLRAMAQRIAHRGPDAEGFYLDEACGLASRRLAIIDIPGGTQPMVHPHTGDVLVFNGEIYNYRSLRSELAHHGYPFATASDTEVLLAALGQWGEEALPRLHGIFAFALWQPRRRTLLLARDRIGEKPLVYAHIPGGIIFASEIKALLCHPAVPRQMDFAALGQTLDHGFCIPPRTFLQDVHQVPPGSILSVHLDHAGPSNRTPQRYWHVPQDTLLVSPQEAASHLHELLQASVAERLMADVPIACYLSGGIDSSSVTTLAAQAAGPLNTISITFADRGADEAPYARLVSRHAGTKHHEFPCTIQEEELPRLVWHLEAPLVTLLHLPLFLLARTARQLGFRVVLTGDGSDEIFAGYDYFKLLKLLPFIAKAPERRAMLLCRLLPPQSQQEDAVRWFHMLCAAPQRHPSLPYRFQAFRFTSALCSDATLEALAATRPDRLQELPPVPSHRAPLDQALYFETQLRLPGLTLPLADTMSMAHGVELRAPFLDHRLVELALRIPARLKLRGLQEKYILKRAMAPLLPEATVARRKQPLAPPAPWFVRTFRRAIGDILSPHDTARRGYFRPAFLQAALQRFDTGGDEVSGILVVAFCTHLFHDLFLEGSRTPSTHPPTGP